MHLLENANRTLQIAIILCGFCSIRRGAICALKYKDIDYKKKTIRVHADIVKSESGAWERKDSAKTSASNRLVHCPDFVLKIIGEGNPEDNALDVLPDTITREFIALRNRPGIKCTFHDLRAFYASSMPLMGVPDFYTALEGGWAKNSSTLKRTYQRVQSEEQSRFAAMSDDFFAKIVP